MNASVGDHDPKPTAGPLAEFECQECGAVRPTRSAFELFPCQGGERQ